VCSCFVIVSSQCSSPSVNYRILGGSTDEVWLMPFMPQLERLVLVFPFCSVQTKCVDVTLLDVNLRNPRSCPNNVFSLGYTPRSYRMLDVNYALCRELLENNWLGADTHRSSRLGSTMNSVVTVMIPHG